MIQKRQIVICLGSSCYRRGNRQILELIKDWLKRNNLEESIDFRGELCTGNCAKGPVIKIDGETIHVDQNSIFHILEKYFTKQN